MPLPNKAGEPEFKLKVEPSDKLIIKYKAPVEAVVSMNITNTLKDRVSFKVKCTDNDIFRVRPPLGFIKPGETATVKISLKPRPAIDPHRHFFAIYHVNCVDKSANPRTVWNADTKPDGVVRMQAVLLDMTEQKKNGGEEDDKKDKKDDKKEDKKDDKKEDKKDEKKDDKKDDKKEEEKKEEEKDDDKKDEKE